MHDGLSVGRYECWLYISCTMVVHQILVGGYIYRWVESPLSHTFYSPIYYYPLFSAMFMGPTLIVCEECVLDAEVGFAWSSRCPRGARVGLELRALTNLRGGKGMWETRVNGC